MGSLLASYCEYNRDTVLPVLPAPVMDMLLGWDWPDIEACSLRKSGPEYRFWTTFFPMVSVEWAAEFDARTAGGGKESEFIWWDFMGATATSKGQQYQEALAVTKTEINRNPALDSDKLERLWNCAQAVLEHRRADHARYPERPGNRMWDVHHLLIEIWADLVETIATRKNKS